MQAIVSPTTLKKPISVIDSAKKYINKIVLQPTTLCNLNCSYCYLADRKSNHRMPIEIAQKIANDLKNIESPITIIWHGGEPLATGISHFEKLLEAFKDTKVNHAIQTNASLIDEDWCKLFKKYSVKIGISVDGPGNINSNRVDFGGNETISKVEKGASLLKKNNIRFGIITVINSKNIDHAAKIFEYAIKLGAHSLAINIEEIDGVNTRAVPNDESVTKFWKDLFDAWSARPIIRIREFAQISKWVKSTINEGQAFNEDRIDLFPTVAWDGDVVLFSPELHSLKAANFNDFVVGNVSKTPLLELMKNVLSNKGNYVYEYLYGVEMCKSECAYFQYCGGGHASNKYAEHQKLNVTETISCRNSRKRLVNAIFENDVEPKNSTELNLLIEERIKKSGQLKNLISHQFKYLQTGKLGSDYDKFNDWDKWDDFDKIVFAEFDDDGNQTGITIGGH